MKKYFGIFQPTRCKICHDHRATRKCVKIKKKICFRCCNEIRIKMDCPQNCKFALKQDSDKQNLLLRNFSESAEEQQHLTDLALHEWAKTKNPQFDNKSPLEFSKTDSGKKKLKAFFRKHERNLRSQISYNGVKELLSIPIEEKRNPNHEDVAKKFLALCADYDYEKTIPLLVNHEQYDDKKLKSNYIRRIASLKKMKALKEFDLIRSALSQYQDEATVEFEINGKYLLTLFLKKSNRKWMVQRKIFGQTGLILSEKDYVRQVANIFAQQNFKQAYKEILKWLKIFPDSPDMHYYLGVYFSTEGNLEKARNSFLNSMELDPNFIEAKYNYAFMFQAEGKMSEAKKIYEEILLEKEDVKTLNNLAVIYEHDGEIGDAHTLLKKALKLEPNFEAAQKNMERVSKALADKTE